MNGYYNKYNLLYEQLFLDGMGFKVFSLRLLHTKIFFIHIFENTEQEERKNIFYSLFFSKCSKIQFYV